MKCILLFVLLTCITRVLNDLYLVVTAQMCPKEGPYPETPAGEFAYAYCDDGEWGVRSRYCTLSSNPIWIEEQNSCKSSKKLIHPPYGSNMVDYKMIVCCFQTR